MSTAPLAFAELDTDDGLLPGHRFYRCPLCPHVVTGTADKAFMLAGLHAGRHGRPGAAVLLPLTHQAPEAPTPAEPATIAEFAFAIEVAAGQAAGRLFA